MKIGVIQVAAIEGEPAKNRANIEKFMQQAIQREVDTLVFPETWNVGFFPKNVADIAEDVEESQDLRWLKKIASDYGVNIVGGSIAIKEQGKLYNRSYVLNRKGHVIHQYDKAHLFSPGAEADYFESGEKNGVFELDGIPCALIICYDLRFPEYVRSLALQEAKVLFVPAQWPHPRLVHWQTLNKARAIENQLYVAAVNGCGSVGQLQSCGHSAVYDPFGEELTHLQEEQDVTFVDVNIETVDEVRKKIPVFRDRKTDLYDKSGL